MLKKKTTVPAAKEKAKVSHLKDPAQVAKRVAALKKYREDLKAGLTSPKKKANLSPLRIIRAYCKQCANGSSKEIELCPDYECLFWYLRFGKREKTMIAAGKGKLLVKPV